MSTFTKQITDDADDGYSDASGALTTNAGIAVGNFSTIQVTGAARFTGVTVPQGVTVSSASLVLSFDTQGGTPGSVALKGVASDNCAAFTTIKPSVDPRTTASTTASYGGTPGTSYSHDVTSIVQEILSRSGWASGNAMGFLLIGAGLTSGTNYLSYNDVATDPLLSPTLTINYTNITISPANAAQAHAATSATVAAKSAIVAGDAAQAHASTSPTIATKNTIVPANAAQAHAATSSTIVSSTITAADALQAHAATSPTIAAKSVIVAGDAAQAHVSTSPTVAAKSAIVPANAAQAHGATSASLVFTIPATTPATRTAAGIGGNLASRTAAGIGSTLLSRKA